MTKVNAKKIADFILGFSQEHGDCITNLRLQKLVYYAQAWHLALKGQPLFGDRIEAWVHGPVVPSLYGKFKKYRWEPIGEGVKTPELPDDVVTHLEEVMDVYGGFSAYQLERMTHSEDPWIKARAGLPPDESSTAVIEHADMENYYRSVAEA